MAKPKGINQKAKWREHSIRLARYADRVQSVYDTLNKEVAKSVVKTDYDGAKPFRFSDYPETKKMFEDVQASFVRDLRAVIYGGTSSEWHESNLVQDLLADKVLKFYGSKAGGRKHRVYYQTNSDVLKAFQERKDKGMNLSQKLWNQSKEYKTEMEYAISSAIEKGTSAVTLSKRLSKYLADFQSLKKDYKEKYGNAFTCQDCEYRSIRLARSEINMAYRKAEQERWKQFDFVLGYEVKLTQNGRHVPDICDDLAGKYPKDFIFLGWHPNCMCYVIPILKTEEQFWNDEDVLDIEEPPQNYKDWITRNLNRIKIADKDGTLPNFLKDNPDFRKYMGTDYVTEWRHRTRNEDEIRLAWKNRQSMIDSGDNFRLNSLRQNAHYIGYDISEFERFIRTTDLKYDKYGDSTIFDEEYDKVSKALYQKRLEVNKSYRRLKDLLNSAKSYVGPYRVEKAIEEMEHAVEGFSMYGASGQIVYTTKRFDEVYNSAKKKLRKSAKVANEANVKEIENALGIKKGHPMSFLQADEGRGNIRYKAGLTNPYSINCQVSVVADELRRRGFDVTALGRLEDRGMANEIAYHTEKPWIEKDTGRTPTKKRISSLNKKNDEIYSELEALTKAKGRYHINWAWNDDYGHVVCLERRANGTLRFYDPQNGQPYDIMSIIRRMDKKWGIGVLKVDGLLVNPRIIRSIVKPL